MAVWEAVPQLGQADHWEIWQAYVTQGGRLQARVWLWQLPQNAADTALLTPLLKA